MVHHPVGGLSRSLDDDVSHSRVGPDAFGIPETFAFSLGWIAPGGLASFHSLPYEPFRFAEKHGNVLTNMEAVAYEEWHDDGIFGLGQIIAGPDAWFFFEVDAVDGCVKSFAANGFDLLL